MKILNNKTEKKNIRKKKDYKLQLFKINIE